jgi:AHBA synthesis associated protein
MTIGAVVFDLDGVLIDSIEVMREAFGLAYADVVGPGEAPFAAYLPHLGRHMPDTLRVMGLPAEMYPSFVRFSRELVHRVPRCDGAGELLDFLRAQGVGIAVATGKVRDRADHVLDAVGLLGHVDAVTGSDEVPSGKPDPAIVLLALRRLGVEPADAFMVGDSPLDLQAGRAAGTRVAAALWGQGARDELLAGQPDLIATSCGELGVELRKLIAREGAGR